MFVMFINCPYSVVDIEFNVSIVGCIYIALAHSQIHFFSADLIKKNAEELL